MHFLKNILGLRKKSLFLFVSPLEKHWHRYIYKQCPYIYNNKSYIIGVPCNSHLGFLQLPAMPFKRDLSLQETGSGLVYNTDKLIKISFLDSRDPQYHHFFCPNISLNSGSLDPLLIELQNSSTVEEVFETLRMHSEQLSSHQACQAVFSLSEIKNMRKFKFKNSSLHIQLEQEFYEIIKEAPEFLRLLSFIEENIDRLSDMIPSLLMCLDNLKLSISHPLMIKLFIVALNNIRNFDLPDLVVLSFVLKDKGIKSYFTQCKLLSGSSNKIKECKSLENLVLLSILFCNTKKLISDSKAYLYKVTVSRFLKEGILTDALPCSVLLVLKSVNILHMDYSPMDVMRPLMKLLLDRVQDLTSEQLILLNGIFLNTLEPRYIMYRIQEHASRLIDLNDNLSLNSELLLCLAPNSTFKMKGHFESLALKLIQSYDYQDPGALYKILRYLKTKNTELCNSFWTKGFENIKKRMFDAENVIGEKERLLFHIYGKYIYFNNNLGGEFRHYKLEEELISFLKEEIKGPTKIVPSKVACMLGFIIAYCDGRSLEMDWVDYLEKNADQLNKFDIAFLSKGFSLQISKRSNQKEKAYFLSKFGQLLDKQSETLAKEVSSLSEVIVLTTSYVLRHGSAASSLLDTLAFKHIEYLDQMTSKLIRLKLRNFKVASYNMPQIFDSVAEYLVVNGDAILSLAAERALTCFFHLGYYPTKVQEFGSVCQEVITHDCEKMQSHLLLESCLALCFYRALSPELIHYIFSIQFLDQLEDEISEAFTKNYSFIIRDLLMKLNRAVCLDYPEEKIPWFHESYCVDVCEMKPRTITHFHEDVLETLGSILGGSKKYIRFNSKSPYHINLDLEFALDDRGRPIPLDMSKKGVDSSSDYIQKPFKRIAVLLRNDNCYSINDRTLNGSCQLERRHLEILGYVVVEVPRHSWYSMAVSNSQDKHNLLKTVIKKELSGIS